jgi:pimeloyl-ACP methyl ester carboxylesterase
VPDRYAAASPSRLLPIGTPQLLVHGARDENVPVTLSRSYAEAARAAGDDADLIELPGADHFDVIDPQHEAWAVVVEALSRLIGN